MNYLEILAIYGVGTVAGIGLFHYHIKERLVSATIESLLADDYVRATEDEDGNLQLHRWYELEDILEEMKNEKDDA